MRTTLKLTEIINGWIADTDILPATKADYRRKINLWFRWLSSVGVDPRSPQQHYVVEYKQWLQDEGRSVLTVCNYVTVVKLFYRWSRWTPPTIIGKRDKLIIALTITNGLRACEVARINIGDFDVLNGRMVLYIQHKGKIDKRDLVAVAELIIELFEDHTACRDFDIADPLFLKHAHGGGSRRLAKVPSP